MVKQWNLTTDEAQKHLEVMFPQWDIWHFIEKPTILPGQPVRQPLTVWGARPRSGPMIRDGIHGYTPAELAEHIEHYIADHSKPSYPTAAFGVDGCGDVPL